MAKFTVDTHLFRELGELLVGRDSTALIELVKNSYDADATSVTVYSEKLKDPINGFIRITDNGNGMTSEEFEKGFLRIASRTKDQGTRVSRKFKRRYTGAKGIGRLAAHKLAKVVEISSISLKPDSSKQPEIIDARIDWDLVEQQETLDQLEKTDAILTNASQVTFDAKPGTSITLKRLRRTWSDQERGRFLAEVQSFEIPKTLLFLPVKKILETPLLFDIPIVRQSSSDDPGFEIILEGDFAPGESYWQSIAETSDWVIEIEASELNKEVVYCIAPTKKNKEKNPWVEQKTFKENHPDLSNGPFFQARIFIREGRKGNRLEQAWAMASAGIRVFLEGFRVLPYGEPGNDWLGIDRDYARRDTVQGIDSDNVRHDPTNRQLYFLPNRAYFGAVWLTQTRAPSLKLLVNREGFIPDFTFENLTKIVRNGINLATRVRASVGQEKNRINIDQNLFTQKDNKPTILTTSEVIVQQIEQATSIAREARNLAATGDVSGATEKITQVINIFRDTSEISEKIISEGSMLKVLASVGTQMASFVHEINSLLGMTESLEKGLGRLRDNQSVPSDIRADLIKVHTTIGELRRNLERQASYLLDVVTPDARRRRSRLSFAEKFNSGRRLVEISAERQNIHIENQIPLDLRSPAMFPAELTTIFTNLLTNAVKAAGQDGRILAWGNLLENGKVKVVIENTGAVVDLEDSERWFKPFESTTTNVDPILGQGMGLGLPITRSLLEEYGAEIRFTKPSNGFATAVEMTFSR